MNRPDMDDSKIRYQRTRIAHWEGVSPRKQQSKRVGAFYHRLIRKYYRFFIPPGLRILELGCGHGDLLACLEPQLGVGVDFSKEMLRVASQKYPKLTFVQADAHEIAFKHKFDVIILSDLVNDLWDVQGVLQIMRNLSHVGTRVFINFYNNLWRVPLSALKLLPVNGQFVGSGH